MNRAVIPGFIVFFLAGAACAQTYYADVSVDIDASGMAQISGDTNHPQLAAQNTAGLTSKKGLVWTFNLTLPAEDIFSDYVYSVRLPAGSSINYVRAESFRISGSDGSLTVSGSASDKPFSIVIQYQTSESKSDNLGDYLLIIAAFILLVATAYYFLGKTPRIREKPSKERKKDLPNYKKYEKVLSERHKDILRVLSKEDKPVNQAALCEKLDLPKSSVSRNVATLCELGIIEKKRVGMSTFISLRRE